MNYLDLVNNIQRKKSFLCVGLDTVEPSFEFNKAIIDATHQYAVAYKPNVAFYEAAGIEGWRILGQTVDYLRANHPDIFIIADAKVGDIGNTAKRYAATFFETMDFDAVTVNPYMGGDAVAPFLEYKDKWAIVLALTSNASAADIELKIMDDGRPVYKHVLENINNWGNKDNTMIVAGATRPEMLSEIREIMPQNFFLVPGVGAQGGTVADVSKYGLNDNCGLLVNVSRGIIYADKTERFAIVAGEKAKDYASQMSQFL